MNDEAIPPAGPLAGLRVLELAAIGPVPHACMMLADLGADVIRVDRPDGARAFADWHRLLDRGRRSVALDLKAEEGTSALLRLVRSADVLVEGFRPGVAERLGVGPEECRKQNPGLVYARMTGWGPDGPLSHAPGHDINYIALSGALHTIGPEHGPPVVPVNFLGDFAGGGMYLLSGVLAALFERHRSGTGQTVDVAITDGTASLMSMLLGMDGAGAWTAERGGNLLDGGAPFYTVYGCSDEGHVAVGALEEKFYGGLLRGLGLAGGHLPDRWDRANWPKLRDVFAARFAEETRDHWAAVFQEIEGCVTPVLTLAEAASHPHHRARGTFVSCGSGHQAAPSPRFRRTPASLPGPACEPGTHTREVLAESGWNEQEIGELLASGGAWSSRS